MFEADPTRSFNRGFTDYFAVARPKQLINQVTPKSMGAMLGKVTKVQGFKLWLDSVEAVHNGDGLCYVDKEGLKGIKVNTVDGGVITANESLKITVGTTIYRNYDHQFTTMVERQASQRKIRLTIAAQIQNAQINLSAEDEDGNHVQMQISEHFDMAKNLSQKEQICRQLAKCGDTQYVVENVDYTGDVLFIPSAKLNEIRRQLLNLLTQQREKNRNRWEQNKWNDNALCPQNIDWKYNVTNSESELFYRQHGAAQVERGFELQSEHTQKSLMTTKYCILHELGLCRKLSQTPLSMPLWLSNGDQRFRLSFDCKRCEMQVIKEE